jgi:hypothetical protein
MVVPSARPQRIVKRSTFWNGVGKGERVVVNGVKERRQQWVFVAHVRNEDTGDEWVEVRGGRPGESKTRAFRTELIHPWSTKKGSRAVGPSLVAAPRLAIHCVN